MSDTDTKETAVAKPEDVTSVYFNDYHDGATGMELADEGRPAVYKLLHTKGYYFSIDDEDEHHDYLDIIIINCRIYYRKFKNNVVICESDNGKVGFDEELNVERSCEPIVEGQEGGCQYSHGLKVFPGQGQCGLGMTIQGLLLLDGTASPIQINMSSSSARAFSTYLKKLRRMKTNMRGVITRMGSKHLRTAENEWYRGDFKTSEEELTPALVQQVASIAGPKETKALPDEETKD